MSDTSSGPLPGLRTAIDVTPVQVDGQRLFCLRDRLDPVTAPLMEAVGRADAEMLDIVCRGDAEGFYEQVMADGDARRIRGLAPIYYLNRSERRAAGQVQPVGRLGRPGRGDVRRADLRGMSRAAVQDRDEPWR